MVDGKEVGILKDFQLSPERVGGVVSINPSPCLDIYNVELTKTVPLKMERFAISKRWWNANFNEEFPEGVEDLDEIASGGEEVTPEYPDHGSFLDEVKKKFRECPGEEQDKLLFLGGAYLEVYFQIWKSQIGDYRKKDPPSRKIFDDLLNRREVKVHGTTVWAVDGNVFAVLNPKEET